MKKLLLITALIAMGGFFYSSNAQCTFANPGIRIVGQPTTVNGKCEISMELYFEIDHNPGGKYFWIHLWPSNAYPNYGYATSQPPTTSIISGGNGALDASIASFGFFHQGSTLTVQPSYPPDANASNFQPAVTISEIEGGGELPGYDRYTVKGLTITLPQDCSIPQPITMDVWESQAAQAQTVACVTKGTVIFVNDPLVGGLLFCGVPREYFFSLHSVHTTGSLGVDYAVHIDNGDGIFNAEQDSVIVNSGNTILDASNEFTFNSGRIGYLPYSSQKPEADKSLWIVVSGSAIPNDIYARLDNTCIGLPVKISSFTAVRRNSTVDLKWQTVTETDNYGFYIERRIADVDWQVVGFMASQARNGTSNQELTYHFTDYNAAKIVSSYRLRQVDLDSKITLSEIRLVRGEDQTKRIIIYPNPVTNGVINIVVEKLTSEMDIIITDMAGRQIKQLKGISAQRVSIPNLGAGMYTVSIFFKGSAEKYTEKIIVE